ncbi:MAG TPA: DoxX family protein [Terracidiphilus sp.]|nr:DoxX family protein [Terracidiphilus sp.]
MLVLILLIAAIPTAIFTERYEGGPRPQNRMEWSRTIAYWIFTMFVAFEMAAGAIWDLLRIEYVRVVLARLGYPMYLLVILGVWRIPCALALLAPRFERLKEWAYAGSIFNYTGAAASHLLKGDAAGSWIGPLVFAGFALASWALRPAARRLPRSGDTAGAGWASWLAPVLTVAAMVGAAFLTLPKGAPPQ